MYEKIKHASYKATHEKITTLTRTFLYSSSANLTRCNDGSGTPNGRGEHLNGRRKELHLQKTISLTDELKERQFKTLTNN